jgi:hypothetical protein
MLILPTSRRESPPLALAWHHTGIFWAQTVAVIEHHPVAVLICAALPAILRGYVLVRGNSVSRGRAAWMDIIVTFWRVLLLAVAIWAACSGREWRALRAQVGTAAAWQLALGQLGAQFAYHLRLVLWELLFFVLAFVLLHWALRRAVRALGQKNAWIRESRHRVAMDSVLRNFVLAPLLVIYLVEMARPAFQ